MLMYQFAIGAAGLLQIRQKRTNEEWKLASSQGKWSLFQAEAPLQAQPQVSPQFLQCICFTCFGPLPELKPVGFVEHSSPQFSHVAFTCTGSILVL